MHVPVESCMEPAFKMARAAALRETESERSL